MFIAKYEYFPYACQNHLSYVAQSFVMGTSMLVYINVMCTFCSGTYYILFYNSYADDPFIMTQNGEDHYQLIIIVHVLLSLMNI